MSSTLYASAATVAVALIVAACNPAAEAPAAPAEPTASGAPATATAPAATGATQEASGASALDAPNAGVGTPVGPFTRTEPSNGELNLRREGDNWRVFLVAGGIPNGAATAADCELQAVGPRNGDRIEAKVVPFEGELGSISAEDLDGTTIPVTVTLSGNTATVDAQEATVSLCPMNSDIGGRYVKAG